jgi:hypothetical protein
MGVVVVVVNAKLKTPCVAATQSTWFCCSSGRPVVVNGLSIKLPTKFLGGEFQDTGLLVPPLINSFLTQQTDYTVLPTMSAASLKGRSFQTSSNPMYMTSKNSAEAAYRARKLVAAGQTAKEKMVPPVDHNTYHYSTVSSSYGTQIGNSDSYVARAMDPLRTEPHREPMNVNVLQEMGFNKDGDGGSAVIEFSSELKAQKTRGYTCKAKQQNPLYVTTSNSIGYKKPEAHELADKIFPMQNKFTETFSGIQYRDQGLNCAIDHKGYIDKGENAW